jgi:hypothetical protein
LTKHICYVITQAELRSLKMWDEDRLRLIQAQHAIHIEDAGLLR